MQKNNFNLIRFFLATFVILSHNIEFLEGDRKNEFLTRLFGTISLGEFSVSCFFIISGFLIVKSWDKNNNVRTYLTNRILRIYPGFIVASIISCFVFGAFGGNIHYFEEFNFVRFLKGLITLNIPHTPQIFANSHYSHINGSLWTIKHEFICYLIVLFLGIISFIKNKKGYILFFILLFSSNFLSKYFGTQIISDFLTSNLELKLIFAFSMGGAYYLFGRAYLNKKPLYIISGILMFICFFKIDLVNPCLAIFGGYLLLSFAERNIPFLSNFNNLPDISYGIYLYGWPISKILINYQPKIDYWLLNVESFCLAVLLGLFSWFIIEKPFMMLKKKLIFLR